LGGRWYAQRIHDASAAYKDCPFITRAFERFYFAPTRATNNPSRWPQFPTRIERVPNPDLSHYRALTDHDQQIGDKTPESKKQNSSTSPMHEADVTD